MSTSFPLQASSGVDPAPVSAEFDDTSGILSVVFNRTLASTTIGTGQMVIDHWDTNRYVNTDAGAVIGSTWFATMSASGVSIPASPTLTYTPGSGAITGTAGGTVQSFSRSVTAPP